MIFEAREDFTLAGDGDGGDEEELAIGDGFGEFLGTLDKGGERASGERSSNAEEEEESVETAAVAIEWRVSLNSIFVLEHYQIRH